MNDIFSFIISVLSLCVAIYAISQTTKNLEFAQYQIIMNMYSELKDIERDLVKYQEGSVNESYQLYEFTQESICNHYEIFCAHYIRNSINKELFQDLFKDNIIRTVENPDYEMFFKPDKKGNYNYCKILEVYDEFKLLNE